MILFYFFKIFFKFYFIFKLYNIVLVLPNIKMNVTGIMLPILSPPPSSLPTPSLWVIPVHQSRASCIMHQAWSGDSSHMIFYMFQCHSPKSSHPRPLPQSPKDCSIHLCLLLSHIQDYRYHLSKFHIYALVYCSGVFLSGLLHSV